MNGIVNKHLANVVDYLGLLEGFNVQLVSTDPGKNSFWLWIMGAFKNQLWIDFGVIINKNGDSKMNGYLPPYRIITLYVIVPCPWLNK